MVWFKHFTLFKRPNKKRKLQFFILLLAHANALAGFGTYCFITELKTPLKKKIHPNYHNSFCDTTNEEVLCSPIWMIYCYFICETRSQVAQAGLELALQSRITCFAVKDYLGLLIVPLPKWWYYRCVLSPDAEDQTESFLEARPEYSKWVTPPALSSFLPLLKHFLRPMQGDRWHNQQQEGGASPILLTLPSRGNLHEPKQCRDKRSCCLCSGIIFLCLCLSRSPFSQICRNWSSEKLTQRPKGSGFATGNIGLYPHRATLQPHSHQNHLINNHVTVTWTKWHSQYFFKATGDLGKASSNSKPGPLHLLLLLSCQASTQGCSEQHSPVAKRTHYARRAFLHREN